MDKREELLNLFRNTNRWRDDILNEPNLRPENREGSLMVLKNFRAAEYRRIVDDMIAENTDPMV